jgi:hypothetical protein
LAYLRGSNARRKRFCGCLAVRQPVLMIFDVRLAELSGKSNTTTYYYSRSNTEVSHHRVVDRAARVVKEDIESGLVTKTGDHYSVWENPRGSPSDQRWNNRISINGSKRMDRQASSNFLRSPDVQISRFRFFTEELRSRLCTDGRSGLLAVGDA